MGEPVPMMRRVNGILRQSQKAVQDLDLLKVLQSEIRHEQSHDRFQNYQGAGYPGDFVVDWDSPASQDVVLRRRCETGEEVAVSALLGPLTFRDEEGSFPRNILMKVCIKKPGLSPVLQFDCGVFSKDHERLEFNIHSAYYLPSPACVNPSAYRGPSFSSLDPNLQDALKEYLLAKGIGEDLTNFLVLHLHKKEQTQYMSWLHKLEAMVARDD